MFYRVPTSSSSTAAAQGFDCELLYYGRHEKEPMKKLGVPLVTDLDEFASRCDVITVNVPLTDKTRGMVNKDVINKMKKVLVVRHQLTVSWRTCACTDQGFCMLYDG